LSARAAALLAALLAAPALAAARAVVPVRLRLDIDLDMTLQRFDASVVHRFRALERPVSRIELESRGLDIKSVADEGGRPLRFKASSATLTVFLAEPLPPGGETVVRVDYAGASRHAGLHFFKSGPAHPGRPDEAWSHGQPDLTGYWIPFAAEPGDRCATEVNATVPEGFSAVSNGVLVSSGAAGAGRAVFRWRQERPHPVHLIALYAARYDFQDAAAPAGGSAVPIRYWFARPQRERAALTFKDVPRMLDFFSRATGTPYPWDKYDVAVIHQSRFGGMENTSAAGLRADFLLDPGSPVDTAPDAVLAHEAAHQWYGDLVSCRGWADAWLNEGFASYMQSLWTESERGRDAFEYDLAAKGRKYFLEARSRRRPLAAAGYARPLEMFDSHSYDKGAWVLHMLRRRVGDAVFWAAIRGYTERNKDAAVSTEDLRAAFERAGAGDLGEFFEQWVRRRGHPVLAVEARWNEAAKELSLSVNQKNPDGAPFRMPLTIAFDRAGNGVRSELGAREQVLKWTLPARPKLIRLDPELALLAEYELDFPEDMLREQLRSDPSAAGRIRAARALPSGPGSVEALALCLARDRFWGVAAACAEGLAKAGPSGSAAALTALRDGTKAADPRVRKAAAAALGYFAQSEEAFAALAALAADPSPFVRGAALEALGSLGIERARAPLMFGLEIDSWNETVRRSALAALGRLGGGDAVLADWAAAGKPAEVRAAALAAAARSRTAAPGRPLALLLATLETEDDRVVRSAAIAALRSLGDPRAASALSRVASSDPEPEMRRAAQDAADALNGKRR